MNQPPEILESNRLILRRPVVSDADSIFSEYASDPEVTRYLVWKPHASIETTREFVRSREIAWTEKTEFTWAITLKGEDKVIGMFGARNGNFKSDIGYALGKKHWNKGIMSEAAKLYLNWALSLPEIHRIWAFCDIENPASGRVLEKIGMIQEAIIKKWVIHPNVSSAPRDCRFYSITK